MTYELENKPGIARVNAADSDPNAAWPGSGSVTLDLTVGNVVVVAQTQWTSLAGSITDNLGNTYAMIPSSQNSGDNIVNSWWISVVQHGGLATISTDDNSYPSIEAIQYSGVSTTNPVDVAVVNADATGVSPVFSTDTADEVVLTVGHSQPPAGSIYSMAPAGSTMVFPQTGSIQRPVTELVVSSLQTGIQTSITNNGDSIWRTSTISLRRK